MPETDPLSGQPLRVVRQSKELDELSRKQKLVSEGHEIERELSSEGGGVLVAHIKKTLTDRIDMLAKNDPECNAFIRLLREMGHKIAIGKKASEEIIKKELREVS